MKNQEDEFYSELDRKALHRSCCTYQTMIIFFVGILLLSIVGTIYGYTQIKKINLPSKIIASTFENKNNFTNKLKNPGQTENIEITVTQEELTAVSSGGLSAKNFIIKNIQVIISQSSVDIFGTLTKPISSQIKITTIPKVENGKIKFEVQKFMAGNLSLPQFVRTSIAGSINKTMDEKFTDFYKNYDVQSVNLLDGKMVISGKLK